MEDKYLVAKTLLECYPHLDDLYDSLTKKAEALVRDGFYAIFPNEQMRLYERINECESRKVGLYNMKYLIEECFRKEGGERLAILKEKYVEKLNKDQMVAKYGVSLRTCYRHIRKGIEVFTERLEEMGYDKKKLLVTFGNEPLFQTTLTKVIREDDGEESNGDGDSGAQTLDSEEINRRNNRPLPADSPLVRNDLGRNGRGHYCA